MSQRFVSRQRGVSFFGLIVLVAVLAGGAVVAARIAPALLEYQAVRKAADRARDSATPDEARRAFDRAAQMDNITSITGKDLEIQRAAGEGQVVSFAYDRQFPVAGPVFLTIKFSGRAP